MPYLSSPPGSRRHFLRFTLGGAAFAVAAGRAQAADTSLSWALLSDTHVPEDPQNESRGHRPYDNLRRVVAEVAKAPVEGVAICGDLARMEGLPGDYESLRRLVEPLLGKLPLAMALGNHDSRANFRKVFDKHPGASGMVKNKHILVIEAPPARFIVLDSVLYFGPGRPAGLIGKAQSLWLEEYLAASSDTPTVIFLHHTLTDEDNALLDKDRFFSIIQPHRKVKAIVYGHSHRYAFDVRDGVHLVNVPATAFNFAPGEPVGWVQARFTAQGADFTLRAFAGDRGGDGKTTSVRWR
jgi:3',5'-cyclic-AMP phosphodiesterase